MSIAISVRLFQHYICCENLKIYAFEENNKICIAYMSELAYLTTSSASTSAILWLSRFTPNPPFVSKFLLLALMLWLQ